MYGDDFAWAKESGEDCKSFLIKIPGDYCLQLLIHLPSMYPSSQPPIFEVYDCFGLTTYHKDQLMQGLSAAFERSRGRACLYEWIEIVRTNLGGVYTYERPMLPMTNVVWETLTNESATLSAPTPFLQSIKTGEPITDRMCTFQAHAVEVQNIHQVKTFIDFMFKKEIIAFATDHILAYRIVNGRSILNGFNQDGEPELGRKMYAFLEMNNAKNVAIIVTRWYGGLRLGPNRFKHIANVARNVLEVNGFIEKKSLWVAVEKH